MKRAKKQGIILTRLKELGLAKVILLLLTGFAGAGFALMLAVSGIARLGSPSVALTLFPNDGVAQAAQADLLVLAEPTAPPPAARSLALAALRNQAINPRALRVLGFYTEATGDFAEAERLVRMAERLSRRESQAQMWLVEASARRGDIKQTLVHYDYALRVRLDNQQILFPRLASAISDPEIRAALVPYIRAKNGWGEMFIADAIARNVDTPALATLMIESGGLADRKANRTLQTSLLNRLVEGGHYGAARSLYLSMEGAKPARLTNTQFDPADLGGRYGPIGWQSIDNVDGGGGMGRDGATNRLTLDVFASAANTRPVMRKLLFLTPGNYGFAVRLSRLESDPGGLLRWQVRCMSGTQGVAVWTAESAEKTLNASFAIPSGCAAQMLELIASGGQGQAGLEATITSVNLVRQ